MAKNDNRQSANNRDRRRDRVVETVKERPYAAAALATVAAGAAAFFLTRNKSDRPLMNWGQETTGDSVKGAGAFKPQGTTDTSPSATQAAALATSGSTTNASASGGTGSSTAPASKIAGTNSATPAGDGAKASGKGLDDTAKTETKVGSIAYGA